MKIGVQIHPQHATYGQMREAAIQAEELGVDAIFNWDHFYPLYGEADGPHFEAWTTLASWAEVTNRVEIGCLVTCNSYRNPQLLADMARTVDHISDGRLILGIGSGWFERDYDEYGYSSGTAASRLRDLRDSLPLLEERMAALDPPPIRQIPVLIGGSGEKMTLQYVARHATTWHTFWNLEEPDAWAHKNGVLEKWCTDIGRESSEIARSVGVDWDKIDDFDKVFAQLEAAAVDEVTLGTGGPDYDMGAVERFLEWRDSL